MPERPANKPGKSTKPVRRRVSNPELRRATLAQLLRNVRNAAAEPTFVPVTGIGFGLAIALALIILSARAFPPLAVGRIADTTLTVRVEFEQLDELATERNQEIAQRATPRVYSALGDAFEQLSGELRRLPTALAGAQSVNEVAPELRQKYGLDEIRLAAIRGAVRDGEATAEWERKVNSLFSTLRMYPLLSSEEYQRANAQNVTRLQLAFASGSTQVVAINRAINIENPDATGGRDTMRDIVAQTGFSGSLAATVVDFLTRSALPTFAFDHETTTEHEEAAAANIDPYYIHHSVGDTIVRRGEPLDETKMQVAREEHRRFLAALPRWAELMYVGGALLAGLAVVVAIAGYLGLFYPRVLRRPWRCLVIASLLSGGLAGATWVTITQPSLTWLAASLPVALVTMIMVIAYDRRMALVIGATLAGLVAVSLDFSVGESIALLTGAVATVWRLRDIRSRADVVSGSIAVAASVAAACAVVGFAERPLMPSIWREIVGDAVNAGLGGFAAGASLLFLLPAIERIFDITTGMTLSELRDPRRHLLRQLQQRAPGTYNHSLNVATIAEAAADAIGADSLHLYVGALYHDIGKINKPDYFVENQSDGFNRHNKLSPAMSLLVIMGHVKDGMELAREYTLPRSLHHYIESHHGTTLVSYFYHKAQQAAEADGTGETPSEVTYRYPGPRPRTKEAAILMLCDSVEGATRAMREPTPARIEALVHSMAAQRLTDGQFDESSLTLRELHVIEAALTKTLCAVYHGRIQYPSDSAKTQPAGKRTSLPAARA